MAIKVDTSGFDKLREKLAEAAKSESVPLPELMPESFMRAYTEFETLQAMCDAGGIESAEDLQSEKWNSFVASTRNLTVGWR